MLRRHESLARMGLTLLAALLVGLLFEAEGLRIWGERLAIGPLRSIAQPVTALWADTLHPSGFDQPRARALEIKAAWASAMQGREPARIDLARLGDLSVSLEKAIHEPYLPVPRIAKPTARISTAKTGLTITHAPLLPSIALLPLDTGSGLQIALAGDSMMAVGLAPALMRGLAPEQGVQLLRAYRSGTGLARPEVFDWLQHYPQMLGANRPHLIICSLGANDGQNVQVGRRVLEFGSAEWDEFYRSRLTAYLDMLLDVQTRVLWIGMPLMKDRRFAQKMRHMNALTREVLADYPQVTWLDPNPALGYAGDAFAQYRSTERGKMVKMRADDGIHITNEGAAYLIPSIREWLAQVAPHGQGQGQVTAQ